MNNNIFYISSVILYSAITFFNIKVGHFMETKMDGCNKNADSDPTALNHSISMIICFFLQSCTLKIGFGTRSGSGNL